MQSKHILLALLVTLIWGVNFPITKLGLNTIDPFILTGIRFTLAAIPLVFLVKRPNVEFKFIVAYGLIFGIGMWGLINYGIESGVHPGIASLLIQFSAFFTMGLGALLFGEKLQSTQIIGALVALIGLFGIIFSNQSQNELFGLLLIVLSAVAWSIGNVIIKKSGVKEVFSFIVWASLFPAIPLLLFPLFTHGSAPYYNLIGNINLIAIFSLIFQVYLATHFAYWGWNLLLKLYPISTVAPLSLLIPVFGITSSIIILHESIPFSILISIIFIIIGLAIGLYKRGTLKKGTVTSKL